MNNLKVALIQYARGRPLIWDRTIVCSKKDRENAWLRFSEGFNLPVQDVRKRWEGMRKMYFHELRAFLRTGKKSDWIYFSKLDSFLRKPVEDLIGKFSVSKGALDSDCVIISSNDDSNESPASISAGCESTDMMQRYPMEVSHSSNEAPDETVQSNQSFNRNLEKSVPQISSEPPKVTSQCGGQGADKLLTCSPFSGNQIVIKPKMEIVSTINKEGQGADKLLACSPFSGNQIVIKPEMEIVSTINKEVDVFVRNVEPSNGDKNENGVTSLNKSTTMEPEKNESLPLILNTTEEVRDELRKIPPIKLTLLGSHPLKPKYPSVSKSKIKTQNSLKPIKIRLPPRSDPSWKPVKQKPCPLSKKSTSGSKRATPTDVNLTVDRQPRKIPSRDDSFSSPQVPLAEDISEYATVNMSENQPNEVELTKNKKNKSRWFKDKMSEWRREAVKLPRDSSIDLTDNTCSETIRESRKNFLLSFLPDMDEMSSEQRKFFKSKLMNLICHQ